MSLQETARITIQVVLSTADSFSGELPANDRLTAIFTDAIRMLCGGNPVVPIMISMLSPSKSRVEPVSLIIPIHSTTTDMESLLPIALLAAIAIFGCIYGLTNLYKMAVEYDQMEHNRIEIAYEDGTFSRWAVNADTADDIAAAVEGIAGPPDTLLT